MDRLRILSGLAAALAVLALPLTTAAVADVDPHVVLAMNTFLAQPRVAHQYSGSRRLEASNGGHRAWLDVRTDVSEASGMLYEVTAEGGSGYIRSRVLRNLLDEEQDLIARRAEASVALTTDNYQFTPEGINAEGLAVVAIQPLRKGTVLIAGKMFVTLDGDLRRVEGRLNKNPSFWTTRVDMIRSYRRIDGVLMPVLLQTTAQLRLLGKSELHMTYRYSMIDARPVIEQ